MFKRIKEDFNNFLEVREFRKRLAKAAEVIKDERTGNFFEEMEKSFAARSKAYISSTDYYPSTNDKNKGWEMIMQHNKSNVDMLLNVFKGFCVRLILEIRINDFNAIMTSDAYQILINLLQKEKGRIKQIEKE